MNTPILPLGAALILSALAAPSAGQAIFPLHPFSRTGDVFVADSGGNRIVRLQDLDFDGRYDGPGETIVFYDPAVGAVPLSNPTGITIGLNGLVYVSDSTQEHVVQLVDLDGDGSCHGPGEAVLYYSGKPGAPVTLPSPQNLTVDFIGNVYVSVAGDGAENQDRIVLLRKDFAGVTAPSEVVSLYEFASGVVGKNIPQDVQVGPDFRLYFVENGTGVPKGVYRMEDANFNGTYDHSEVKPFFIPPAIGATAFFWGMTIDRDGWFYVADTGNDVIWRFRDVGGNTVVDPQTEASIWWTSPAPSLLWRVAAASDGSLFAAETQDPDRILRFRDDDGDGVIDPVTEAHVVWSDLVSAVDIVNPRSLAMERSPTLVGPGQASLAAPWSIGTWATVNDLVALYWSVVEIAPLPLPPFGHLGILPGAGAGDLLTIGAMPYFGSFEVMFPALQYPGLVGQSIHFQAIVGKLPARLRLTNVESVTFAP